MPRHRILRFCLPVILLVIAGCSSDDNKIGSTETGKRLPVFHQTQELEVDKTLESTHPKLSEVSKSSSWEQAGYDTTHVLPNADWTFSHNVLFRENIGSGSDNEFKLITRPVVGHNIVFTMDSEGLVSAYHAESGKRMWRFDSTPDQQETKAMSGGLAYLDNVLYVTTGFGETLALEAEKGRLIWRHQALNPIRAAPTVTLDHVYVVHIDNQLACLDRKTGVELWHHSGISEPATLMGASNPAALDESVVVAYSSGEIFNLRSENGRVLWNYTMGAPIQGGNLPAIADIRGLPVIDGGRVFAVSHSGRMASIDERTGERYWETDLGGTNTPVISGDTVFILTTESKLVALTRDGGRIMWIHDLPKHEDEKDPTSDPIYWNGPTLAHDQLLLVNSQGKLVAFSTEDGHPLDELELGTPLYVPPVIASGILYLVGSDGDLIALH